MCHKTLYAAGRAWLQFSMSVRRQVSLAAGEEVTLRPAGPGDAVAIARLYAGLSAQSAHNRFQTWQFTPDMADRLARIDAPGTFCIVAEADDPSGQVTGMVAEARSVPIGTDLAEFAITVGDHYQGIGLGSVLLGALAEHARASPLSLLRAVVLLSNTPMLRLVARYGWAQVVCSDDMSMVTLDIAAAGGMPGWTDESRGRRVLVEQRGWYVSEEIRALEHAGDDLRRCPGPDGPAGRPCPLVVSGRCRLAEQADEIICLLPAEDQELAQVAAAHRRLWPERLAR